MARTTLTPLILALSLWTTASPAGAQDSQRFDLQALHDAWSPADLRALVGHPGQIGGERRRAATQAVLDSLTTNETPHDHPAYAGRIGSTGLLEALAGPLDHAELSDARELLSALGSALNAGVITGYDVRHRNVYAGFEPGHTLTYSHSSPRHLVQLCLLMAHKQFNARIFRTPKVSAFLYRDGWQGDPDSLVSLPDGTRVILAEEMAVLFEFESKADRARFHNLIMQYAKKDERDESGLIADAWWQPFYYSDEPASDFQEIALTFVANDRFEATLTSTIEKRDSVRKAFANSGLEVRSDRVWVNPAFHRFLNGGYQ